MPAQGRENGDWGSAAGDGRVQQCNEGHSVAPAPLSPCLRRRSVPRAVSNQCPPTGHSSLKASVLCGAILVLSARELPLSRLAAAFARNRPPVLRREHQLSFLLIFVRQASNMPAQRVVIAKSGNVVLQSIPRRLPSKFPHCFPNLTS